MSDTSMSSSSLILAIGLHVLVVCIAGWDLYVTYLGRRSETVSYIIATWSRDFPLLPFVTGILMGHLFWTQRIP